MQWTHIRVCNMEIFFFFFCTFTDWAPCLLRVQRLPSYLHQRETPNTSARLIPLYFNTTCGIEEWERPGRRREARRWTVVRANVHAWLWHFDSECPRMENKSIAKVDNHSVSQLSIYYVHLSKYKGESSAQTSVTQCSRNLPRRDKKFSANKLERKINRK